MKTIVPLDIIPLDNPELFLNAKKYLEDNNIIQTEQTIGKFIESLSLDKTVYVKDDIVIPFSLIDKYLFYTPISKDKDDEFLNELKTLNYEFTKLIEDGLTIDFYCAFSKKKLKNLLDDYFNEMEYHLNNFADIFKILFKGKDYDEYYYQVKVLIETINDIKIILNILAEINKHE